jgi:tetratricopeptide (TPR) repeat protein
VAALEKGLRFAPGNRIVLVNLGLAYYRLEKFNQAVEAYEPVVRSDMPYPHAYWEYARVLTKTGQFDEARSVLQKGLTVRPVAGDTYDYLAAFAWKDGDSVNAKSFELRSMEGSANRKRTWDEVFDSIGRILIDLREPRLAVRFLQKAVAADPDSAPRHAALARAFLALGDSATGEREAQSALVLNEGCNEAHALLGRLYQERGSYDDARTHFRKFLERDSLTATAFDIQRRLSEL